MTQFQVWVPGDPSPVKTGAWGECQKLAKRLAKEGKQPRLLRKAPMSADRRPAGIEVDRKPVVPIPDSGLATPGKQPTRRELSAQDRFALVAAFYETNGFAANRADQAHLFAVASGQARDGGPAVGKAIARWAEKQREAALQMARSSGRYTPRAQVILQRAVNGELPVIVTKAPPPVPAVDWEGLYQAYSREFGGYPDEGWQNNLRAIVEGRLRSDDIRVQDVIRQWRGVQEIPATKVAEKSAEFKQQVSWRNATEDFCHEFQRYPGPSEVEEAERCMELDGRQPVEPQNDKARYLANRVRFWMGKEKVILGRGEISAS